MNKGEWFHNMTSESLHKEEYMKDPQEGYFPPGTEHEDVIYEMNGLHFVWDKAKNEANIKAHGVDLKLLLRSLTMIFA